MKRRKKTTARARLDRFLLKKTPVVPVEAADVGKVIESSALAIIAAILSSQSKESRPVTDYLREALLLLALANLYFSEQERDTDAWFKARDESQLPSQPITLREAMRALGYTNMKGLFAAIERVFPPKDAHKIRTQKVIAVRDVYKVLERNELGKRTRARMAREGKMKRSSSSGK